MSPISSVTDWQTVPVFGFRREKVPCVIRESAYALFADSDGRLAIVQSTDGTFLPGGGLETGEMVADAISREALEECGLIVCAGRWFVRAIQFAYSEKEHTQFEKRSTFLEGIVTGSDVTLLQEDHDLHWENAADAMRLLSHESHRWAVEQWLNRGTNRLEQEEQR